MTYTKGGTNVEMIRQEEYQEYALPSKQKISAFEMNDVRDLQHMLLEFRFPLMKSDFEEIDLKKHLKSYQFPTPKKSGRLFSTPRIYSTKEQKGETRQLKQSKTEPNLLSGNSNRSWKIIKKIFKKQVTPVNF